MKKHFNNKLILFLLQVIFSGAGFSQTINCADIKNGVFVFFSKKDGTKSVYTRSGNVQKEFNPSTRETVFWDLEWVSDCAYTLKYNSGLEDKPKQEMELLKKHKFLYQISSVTEDYYVFESFLDKATNTPAWSDTLWIKQRKDAKNKTISNPRIDSLLAIRKAAYDDWLTRTATLYIFRPGKFSESLDVCTIYCNDTAICTMTNKAAYIVRLLKEGPMTFVAKVRKQEMPLKIDVQYGKKYYLRCEIKWAIPARPILTLSDLNEAKPYFDEMK
ncbi:MAG TPA: hypothetical protein VMT76_08760 [Puia sp.]|nr:hypothetical protein [Puia sp.]